MKIYRINPVANARGNFIYKMVVQCDSVNWFDESWRKIDSGVPLLMKWNNGCKTKKISNLIPTTSPGILLDDKAAKKMDDLLARSTRYIVNTTEGQSFKGYVPINFNEGDVIAGHLLSAYPKHNYTMVSEDFKRLWEENGFTGAVFKEVDEIDDAAFSVG